MRYAIDCEFVDIPNASELISLAIVREDGDSRYFEFYVSPSLITSWLAQNVVPHLSDENVTFAQAATDISQFIGGDQPEFWCYYGAYDWYWFCRLFGGFMQMPQRWPHRFKEFAEVQHGVPDVAGPPHHALNDARSLMAAMRKRCLV